MAMFLGVFERDVRAQTVESSFDPAQDGLLCALTYDPFEELIWVYTCFGETINAYTRQGDFVRSLPRPGDSATLVDVEIAPEQLTLNGTVVPAGTLLFIDGESGPGEIFAVDPQSGQVLASLQAATNFSAIVGGAYHPGRDTFFLVDFSADLVSEIDPQSGALLQAFTTRPDFNLFYGDIDVSVESGNLFLISSVDRTLGEFTPEGMFVQHHLLPPELGGLSGLGLNCSAREIFVAGTGGIVSHVTNVPCDTTATIRITESPFCAAEDLPLAWTGLGGANAYRLDFASAPDPERLVASFDVGNVTSIQFDATNLADERRYFARVSGSTDGGATYSAFSPFSDAILVDRRSPQVEPPAARLLLGGEQVYLQLFAEDFSPLTFYRIQVSETADFNALLVDEELGSQDSYTYYGSPGETIHARFSAQDCAGNDSGFSGSVEFTIPTQPDLVVSGVVPPVTGFSGTDVEIGWTITNDGSAGSSTPRWFDEIYLSTQPTYDGSATSLGKVQNLSALGPGESYINSAIFMLPQGIQGTFFLHVVTDSGQDQDETEESNNQGGSVAFNIVLSPYADVEVTQIVAADNVFSGDSLDIAWTVKNVGTAPTAVADWADTIYLSEDDVFDFNFVGSQGEIDITELPLITVTHTGVLDPGEEYTATVRIKLPDTAIDDHHLFVYTDVRGGGKQPQSGDVYEYTQELDNWSSDPLGITLTPPPDLAVTSVDSPGSTTSGEAIDLTWTVENQGPGATREGYWVDLVYYSPTPVFDPLTAILLGNFSHVGTLGNNDSYVGSGLVTVPNGVSGNGYFFVETDFYDTVFEHTFEDNNRSGASPPSQVALAPYPDITVSDLTTSTQSVAAGGRIVIRYTVENVGTAEAARWTDSLFVSMNPIWNRELASPVTAIPHREVLPASAARTRTATVELPPDLNGTYYLYVIANGEERIFEYPDVDNDTARSSSIPIAPYPAIDLVATAFTAPASLTSGAEFSWSLGVRNAGGGGTLVNRWLDALYLSEDDELNLEEDELLETVRHLGALPPSDSYDVVREVRLPNGLSGDYYLIARADVNEEVSDADFENNASPRLIEVTMPAPADMFVSVLDAPDVVSVAQPVQVDWTVQNTGPGETQGDVWYDAVYFSRDPSLDPGDQLLGALKHTGSLASGRDYMGSLEVTVPAFASGSWYLLMKTDSRDDVYEHLAEQNNVVWHRVEIVLPPATDLTVTEVIAPTEAIPGEDISVSWTIENLGPNPAQGTIREAVFISDDSVWDIDDPLVGVSERQIDLDPGATGKGATTIDLSRTLSLRQNGEIMAVLPGVAPGDYYLIVRTNLGGSIRETDSNNNFMASGQLTTNVATLILGESVSFTASSGQTRYYRVDVPTSGEDVVFSLSPVSGGDGSMALYARRDSPPTTARYDEAAAIPFRTTQQITIPGAEAGAWYVLVQSTEVFGAGLDFTLSAAVLDFSISSIEPNYGGNTGIVTVKLEGAKFNEGGQVFFQDAFGGRHAAFETYVGGSTSALARFNLRGQTTGIRDVVFVSNDGSEVILTNGFEVVDGIGALPYVITSYPSDVRSSSNVTVQVTIGNDGTENAMDQFLIIGARGRRLPTLAVGSVIGKWAGDPDTLAEDVWLDVDFPWMLKAPMPPAELSPQFYVEDDLDAIAPIWLYEIPPGSELTFEFTVSHSINEGYVTHAAMLVPMPESPFTQSGSIEDIESSVGYQLLSSAANTALDEIAYTWQGAGTGKAHQDNDVVHQALNDMLTDLATSAAPGRNTVKGILVGVVVAVVIIALIPEAVALSIAVGGISLAASIGGFAGGAIDASNTADSAANHFGRALDEGSGGFFGGNTGGAGRTVIRRSYDPNDIIGPESYGDANWVSARQVLPYMIRFENDSLLASAPAQVVEIRHTLDPTVDERSFRLGSFGFANMEFHPPENVASYRERLDLRDSLGVLVDVTAGIDVQNNEAFWIFQSIHPDTGIQPVNDPYLGFLPVNDTTGVGEGFARYTILADPSAATGDEIVAEAEIFFDMNPPIETPRIVNTVDADNPSSSVMAAPSGQDPSSVDITWSESDIGSGVRAIELYRSENGGPYRYYATATRETSWVVAEQEGEELRFFTRAIDNVGNSEPLKNFGVLVSTEPGPDGEGLEVPKEFALHGNYPNPFNPMTIVPFDLPEPGVVEFMVYDVLGRRVLNTTVGALTAGRHELRLNMGRFASGVYFYEIRVRSAKELRFRDIRSFVLVR